MVDGFTHVFTYIYIYINIYLYVYIYIYVYPIISNYIYNIYIYDATSMDMGSSMTCHYYKAGLVKRAEGVGLQRGVDDARVSFFCF